MDVVDRWFPDDWYRREKRFEEDLAKFLRENLSDTTVRTQGRQRIDIRVGEDTGIELKRDLTPTKVDRLIGQIERYDFHRILVVVCGSSENAWELLREQVRRYDGFAGGKRVLIFRKEEEDLLAKGTADDSSFDEGVGSEGLFGLG